MKFKVKNSNCARSRFRFPFLVSAVFILSVFVLVSCSIPNLEKQECIEARETVKQFYSFHFGNEMKPDTETLKKRENFLSPRLFEQLSLQGETVKDYFTQTEDFPKAFRVGACEAPSADKTVFEVLLFWKDETRSEQRELRVEAVKENEKWLIDQVASKQ